MPFDFQKFSQQNTGGPSAPNGTGTGFNFSKFSTSNPSSNQTAPDKAVDQIKQQLAPTPTTSHPLDSLLQKAGDAGGAVLSGISGVGNAANQIYQNFTQAPVIKQFAQGVGKVTGAAGAGIAGATTAPLEYGAEAVRSLESGKKFDTGRVMSSIQKNMQGAGETFQKSGEAAAPAALTGGVGGFVPNALLLLGQGTAGSTQLSTALQNHDWVGAFDAAQQLVAAGVGAHGAMNEAGAKGGTILTPEAKAQAMSELNFLGNKVRETVGMEPHDALAAKSAAEDKAATAYREVLRPQKGEIKKIEVTKGKNLDDLFKLAVQEKLPVESTKTSDGRMTMDTEKARTAIADKMDETHGQLRDALEANPSYKLDLEKIRDEAHKQIDDSGRTALERKQMKADANEIIDAEIEDGGRKQPGVNAQDLKQSMWRMGYKADRPTQNYTSRIIGNVLKNDIEAGNKGTPVEALNSKWSDYKDLHGLLENAHGRVVKGGVMGRFFANIAGHIAGSTLPLGPLGSMAGGYIASHVHDALNAPEGIIGGALKNVERAGAKPELPPSLLEKGAEHLKTNLGASIQDVSGGKPGYENLPASAQGKLKQVPGENAQAGFLEPKKTDNAPKYPGELGIEKSKNLPPELAKVEKNAALDLEANKEKYLAKAAKLYKNVINTDNYRELFKDYAPGGPEAKDQATKDARSAMARAVHEPASAISKEIYRRKLGEIHDNIDKTVSFLGGGPGSGKTSAVGDVNGLDSALKKSAIVYDGTLDKFDSAKDKIDQALNNGNQVQIIHVFRDPVESMVGGTLPRAMRMGRTVLNENLAKSHFGARETLLKLADHYKGNPNVEIRVIDNSRGYKNAAEIPIDKLPEIGYTKAGLGEALSSALEKEYAAGKISDAVYEGSKGAKSAAQAKNGRADEGTSGKPQRKEVIPLGGRQGHPASELGGSNFEEDFGPSPKEAR